MSPKLTGKAADARPAVRAGLAAAAQDASPGIASTASSPSGRLRSVSFQPWLAASALWLALGLTPLPGAQYLVAGSRATAPGGVRA